MRVGLAVPSGVQCLSYCSGEVVEAFAQAPDSGISCREVGRLIRRRSVAIPRVEQLVGGLFCEPNLKAVTGQSFSHLQRIF